MDALEVGGVASHLTGSMGRLARSKFDLRVANLGPSSPLSEELRKMKVKVYDLDVEGPFALPRRVLALRKLIRQLEIDVVHSYGHAGPVARLAAGSEAASSMRAVSRSGERSSRPCAMLQRSAFTSRSSGR